jgi:gas vesicle protein
VGRVAFWVGLLVGLFVGACFGLVIAGLMAAAARGDELERLKHLERESRRRRDEGL